MKSWTQGRHLPTTRLFVWPPHDFRHLWIVSLSLAVVTSSSLWTLFPSAVQAQQPPTKPTVKNAMMMTTTTQSSTTKTAAAKSSVTSDDGSVATALPELTNELVTEILHYKGIYADQEEEDACRRLVLELTPEELETAAHSSYAFWWYATTTTGRTTATRQQPPSSCADENVRHDDDLSELRLAAAQREARRHYVAVHRNPVRALASLRQAVALRQKYHVDLLRWMGRSGDNVGSLQQQERDTDERERLTLYRKNIADEMEKQMTAVVGLDEAQRAMILKATRTNSETDIEGYLIMQMYVAERAMALTEVVSRGRQERVFVVFDFAGYNSQHAPPALELRGALQDLQALYKERLHKLVILDPPFFLKLIYNIVAPFLDSHTRSKVAMVSGAAERLRIVTASPERKAALSCLLMQNEEKGYGVRVETFLDEISFHEYYNLATPPIAALS